MRFDSNLVLFLLSIFLIWLFRIIGETLDSIIRWAGRTIGLISMFKLFMTTDLCLSVRFAIVRLLSTCIVFHLIFLRGI